MPQKVKAKALAARSAKTPRKWHKTKEGTEKGWDATKEGAEKGWNKTKQGASELEKESH
jgi:hypothetical protein